MQMAMGAPEWSRPVEVKQASSARDAPAPPPFRELFEQHFSFVWNTLKRLGVQERDLEDLAQQVFLQVHGQLEAYDATRPLRPWLFGFAYHAASNYRALARHRVELSVVAPEPSDPHPPADELLITRQELELAEQALARVPFERRAVLLMHEVQGHSVPELARTLAIPVNTAYSRLRLARQDYEQAVRRLRAQRREP
jgi:RNA polymerase sigma-70 factor (ECF subfamily)